MHQNWKKHADCSQINMAQANSITWASWFLQTWHKPQLNFALAHSPHPVHEHDVVSTVEGIKCTLILVSDFAWHSNRLHRNERDELRTSSDNATRFAILSCQTIFNYDRNSNNFLKLKTKFEIDQLFTCKNWFETIAAASVVPPHTQREKEWSFNSLVLPIIMNSWLIISVVAVQAAKFQNPWVNVFIIINDSIWFWCDVAARTGTVMWKLQCSPRFWSSSVSG